VDFDFTGDRQDLTAGLYDTPNRELNPSGRWISPDPAHASWNAYSYGTNPLGETDPSGACAGATSESGKCQPGWRSVYWGEPGGMPTYGWSATEDMVGGWGASGWIAAGGFAGVFGPSQFVGPDTNGLTGAFYADHMDYMMAQQAANDPSSPLPDINMVAMNWDGKKKVKNDAAVGGDILGAPDFLSVNVNAGISYLLNLVGPAVAINIGRNGHVYLGGGVNVGKGFTFVSGSGTANWMTQPSKLQSFLTKNSFSFNAGWWAGVQGTWTPGSGLAGGGGFVSPQVGGAWTYSFDLGKWLGGW